MSNDNNLIPIPFNIKIKLQSFEDQIFIISSCDLPIFKIIGIKSFGIFAKAIYAAYKKYKYIFEKVNK